MPAKFPEQPPAPRTHNNMTTNQHSNNVRNTTNIAQSLSDELVISGISARLPESSNMEEFGQNLFGNVDMITDDGRRWTPGLYGLPTRCGKIKELDKFDATFFGVHAKQANLMDPQLRMLLEVTYEAIVDAGINPSTIRGTKTGVFIGASASESDEAWSTDPDSINGYGLTGCCRAMFANRLSYTFDFKGPSFAIDTACSSGLLALEQAVAAIRAGQCDAAIVGGVNLLLKPQSSLQFHRLNMLAPDGKCKAFDISGNGYVRSEAAVAIYIQKSTFANRSYATILHAKTNTDGNKEQGITFPAGAIQQVLLEEVYSEAGVNPADVTYVEAHGTGTKVGDPQELNAIANVFCKGREPSNPLLIGSVKSNMGHSEPASGLCSIAKIVHALQEGVIPANLHFNTPNPDIPALSDGRFKVVSENHPWNGGIIGINSFGFGGANVHVVLKSNPKKKPVPVVDSTPVVTTFSGRTKEAVESALKTAANKRDEELTGLFHQLAKHDIPGHHYRGYSVATAEKTDLEIDQVTGEKPPVWFVFSGMGSQWSGMGKDLMQFPIFEASIKKSQQVLKPHNFDLIDVVLNGTDETFDNVLNAFVSIAAIQVALVDLLFAVGVTPDGIVGHSVGELGCAYADGCFTAEQTVLAAFSRGRAILESKLEGGAMAAVGLTWEDAKARCPEDIIPACHNAVDSVSISGPVASIKKFVEQLKSEGVFAKEVKSSGQAFHSKYIGAAGPKLRTALDQLVTAPKPRSSRWISSSIPEDKWDTPLAKLSSAAYHVNNLLSPVLFHEAISHVPENALVIEIAPHALLQAILKRSLPSKCINVGLMNRSSPDNSVFFLSSLGKIYIAGHNPSVDKLYPKVDFPVALGTPMINSMVQWDHSITWDVAKFGQGGNRSGENIVEVSLSNELDAYLAGHTIDGRILFPATGYMFLVWKTFAKIRGTTYDQLPVVFENVSFQRATILQKDASTKFLINILEGSGEFEVYEGGSIAVSGWIKTPEDIKSEFLPLKPLEIPEKPKHIPLSQRDVYQELRLRGYDYHSMFKGIKTVDNQGAWGKLNWEENWVSYLDTMLQFSILSQPNRGLYLPVRLQQATIDPKAFTEFIANNKPEIDEHGVPVYKYKNLNVVKSHGVELKGLKASLAPKRTTAQSAPKLEEYVFAAYKDEVVAPEATKARALRTCVDLVIENTQTLKLKIAEVVEQAEEAVVLDVHDIAMSQPMYQDDVTLFTVKSEAAKVTDSMQKAGLKLTTKDTVEKLVPEQGTHLLVVHNSEKFVETLEASVKDGGFVLLMVPAGQTVATVPKFNTVAKKMTKEQDYYLFRKINEATNKAHVVIPIDNQKFDWVEKVKEGMTLASTDPEAPKMYLFSQNNPQSGILGLVNCLKQEPGGHVIRAIFTKKATTTVDFNKPSAALKTIMEHDLLVNIVQDDAKETVGSYRHFPITDEGSSTELKDVEHAYINTLMRGDLSSLKWIEGPLKYYKPERHPNTELCHVYYAPLNFRDIMLATGKLPPDALPGNLAMQDCVLGLEFAGKNSNGKRIMGLVDARGLATTVLADPTFMWEVPKEWSLEEAATVPVCYATAYYALVVRGKLTEGETVLIHSGSGGVGQAAIAIALSMNCKVFTTVGSQDKKDLLKKLFPKMTEENFANSRDTSFEQHILEHTDGRGVDLVLNSLAAEKLQASVRTLATHGRFLEIGKFDLSQNSPLGMAVFLKNVTFHGILLDALFDQDSVSKRQVVELVANGIKSGAVKPLPKTVFSDDQIEEAFRFMASGKHVGKVLLKIQDEKDDKKKMVKANTKTYFNPSKSVVIIGGVGGFGLELSNWLIERGVSKLVLVSRSGVTTGYQDMCIRRWREQGITVETPKADVTTVAGAKKLIEDVQKMGPIGGIYNLAMVLKDGFMENQTVENFVAVTKPKVDSTLALDQVTRAMCPDLEQFVIFSSVSCGRGNAGQANYGLANSAMERICEQRVKDGFKGLAIQWGAIGDVGVVADHMGGNDTVVGGTLPQRMPSCLNALDVFLQHDKPVVASMVLADKSGGRKEGGKKATLVESVAHVLGMKDVSNVNGSANLAELGMDSLMGVEVKQTLERDYDLVLSMQEIRQLTLNRLKEIDEEDGSAGMDGEGNLSRRSSLRSTGDKPEMIDLNDESAAQIKLFIQELMPKQCVVKMNEGKKAGNVFVVHPIEGVTLSLQKLASQLQETVYGIQCVKDADLTSVEKLAAYYIKQIKTVQPKGPYNIAGYSYGCTIALEMALQLEKEDKNQVKNLVFLDGSHKYVSAQTEEYKNRQNVVEIGAENEADAFCTFLMQFLSFEYLKVRKELIAFSSLEERVQHIVELLAPIMPQLPKQDIGDAARSFYFKLLAVDKYQPGTKYTGKAVLIKALGNRSASILGPDYSLSQVCQSKVEIHGVDGNHRSFIDVPSVEKVAQIMNKL